jgi:lipopolysaccharide/colanic/teichoic acid biosynthesis glycosyltransferase
MYQRLLKPLCDILAALILLLLLSPLFIIVTVWLFFANKGKPFFVQPRAGKKGAIFHIVKFKTMNDKRDINGQLLPDDERLTAIGKVVRKSSLDELPQLINVLKGQMSLVGPRPFLVEYLPLYNSEQAKRHDVKPGITGWAQINGRNAISWNQKFAFDLYYVEHIGFALDFKILWLTLWKVFRREGINSQGYATYEKFTGNA